MPKVLIGDTVINPDLTVSAEYDERDNKTRIRLHVPRLELILTMDMDELQEFADVIDDIKASAMWSQP